MLKQCKECESPYEFVAHLRCRKCRSSRERVRVYASLGIPVPPLPEKKTACSRCGGSRTRTGYSYCNTCSASYSRERRYELAGIPEPPRKQRGVCEKCGSNADFAPRTCQACRAETRRSYRQARPELIKGYKHKRRAASNVGHYTEAEWLAIVERQKGRCACCHGISNLHVDHIVPVSLGGSNLILNIQGLCKSCNSRKGARLLDGVEFSIFDRVAC